MEVIAVIVNRRAGAVGSWWFEDRSRSVRPHTLTELQELLRMCRIAAQILDRHGLLQPTTIELVGWTRFEPATGTLSRADRPDLVLSVPRGIGAGGIVEVVETALEQLQPFLYPVDIEVKGTGVVLDAAARSHVLPDITWLAAKTLDAHVMEVGTQSDAWLPYTLSGVPQRQVWQHNAPRLEAALREIQAALGVAPVAPSHTTHAVIDGLRLSNHVDVDGDVIATCAEGDEA
jgi:hypothetical protein